MKEGAPVSRMYLRMYYRRLGLPDLTGEELNDIVLHSKYKETTLEDGTSVFGLVSSEEKQQLKKQALQNKSKQSSRALPLSPELLLRSFTLALAAEAREFAFPYLEMHTLSMSVLKEVQDRCGPHLKEVFGRNEDMTILTNIVSKVLLMARSKLGDNKIFREAALVIQECASEKNGAIISKIIADIPSFPRAVPKLSSTDGPTKKYLVVELNIIERSADNTKGVAVDNGGNRYELKFDEADPRNIEWVRPMR